MDFYLKTYEFCAITLGLQKHTLRPPHARATLCHLGATPPSQALHLLTRSLCCGPCVRRDRLEYFFENPDEDSTNDNKLLTRATAEPQRIPESVRPPSRRWAAHTRGVPPILDTRALSGMCVDLQKHTLRPPHARATLRPLGAPPPPWPRRYTS